MLQLVATDPAAAAPRKALLQLCASCGIPKHGVSSQAFTSMTAAEQAFSLYQHHTRGSEPSAAQAGQGSRDDPAAGPAAALSRFPQHQPAVEHAAAQQLIPITSPIPDTASIPALDHGPASTSNLHLPEGGPSASLCTPADHCNPMPPPTIFNTMAASPPQADEVGQTEARMEVLPEQGQVERKVTQKQPDTMLHTDTYCQQPASSEQPISPQGALPMSQPLHVQRATPEESFRHLQDGLPDSLPPRPLTGCHTGPSPPSSA
ncbi:hypothetical protein HaLaN_04869, partial [Haematococcus lacustris]